MELIRYLEDAYLDESALLSASGLTAPTLTDLQARRLMPQPSYTLRLDIGCISYFGAHAEQASARYYAHGCVKWAGTVRALVHEEDGFRVFAGRYLARLEALGGAAHQPDLREEWRHFLSGTYGLCTRSGLPEDIAAKELAAATIRSLAPHGVADLDGARRECLLAAIDLLDLASSPFAPHERARSSRHALIDTLRAQLALVGDG
ncbi:hypothetical protein ASC94_20100 [Massilia sp. Root418]|uniref:DUF6058 family natural product biosynthesis protein n=1 Tax=Massilia sp. Root418 TaxID=1736532 RepID=UPI0006FCDE53|nr:DUF6058 family natural product biosynthesis protein [Massilia sp. Root418]KQW90052.1 hypothetical protein ASC94_20100 [Massilia sp. Root418]